MLKQLMDNLEDQSLDDFWYDVRFEIASDILVRFSTKDWQQLKQMLPFECEIKNQCILECLATVNDVHSLSCIQKIAENCNVELLRCCVLALINHNLISLSEQVKNRIIDYSNVICNSSNENLNEILRGVILRIMP